MNTLTNDDVDYLLGFLGYETVKLVHKAAKQGGNEASVWRHVAEEHLERPLADVSIKIFPDGKKFLVEARRKKPDGVSKPWREFHRTRNLYLSYLSITRHIPSKLNSDMMGRVIVNDLPTVLRLISLPTDGRATIKIYNVDENCSEFLKSAFHLLGRNLLTFRIDGYYIGPSLLESYLDSIVQNGFLKNLHILHSKLSNKWHSIFREVFAKRGISDVRVLFVEPQFPFDFWRELFEFFKNHTQIALREKNDFLCQLSACCLPDDFWTRLYTELYADGMHDDFSVENKFGTWMLKMRKQAGETVVLRFEYIAMRTQAMRIFRNRQLQRARQRERAPKRRCPMQLFQLYG